MASSSTITAGKAYVIISAIDRTKHVLATVSKNVDAAARKMQSVGTQLMMGAGLAGIGTALPIRQFARFEDSMLSVRAKMPTFETDEYSELSAAIQNCSGVTQKTADMIDSSLGGSFRFVLTASTAVCGLLNVVVNGFLNTLFLGRYVVVGFAASLGLVRTAAMGIPTTIATTKASILVGVTTVKTAILGISATFVAIKTAIVAASVSLYASFVTLPATIGAIVASMTFAHVAAVAIFAGIATLCGVVLWNAIKSISIGTYKKFRSLATYLFAAFRT